MEHLADGVKGLGKLLTRSPTARSILAGQFPSAENKKGRVKRTKCTCFYSKFKAMTISDSTPSSLPILFRSENIYDRGVFSSDR